ncbi:outer membrane protein assembly factor BamB family protein [Gemmata sp.]|uniref:outer membrane protein assembly factor BamB family protein n=1 Tax=Gemmata sp. TaxID=1914242 RepID=UPI003F6FEC72
MRRFGPLLALAVLLPLLARTGPSPAGDSPQFRGPGGTGVFTDARPPVEWGKGKNVAWKVAVPGVAWSCPIVVGDKVILTTAVSPGQPKPQGGGGGFGGGKGGGGKGGAPKATYQFKVVCLDRATGKPLWEKVAKEAVPTIPTHGSNTYATETPVTDGERVYAYFGMTGLYCYDLDGKQVWAKDLGSYPMQAGWGTASSPVLDGDRLVVQCDNEEKSFLVALDKRTGKELWRTDRAERSGWSTPFVWKTKDRTDIVAAGGRKIRGYDPAQGKVVWELDVGGGQCSASPVGDAERLYVGVGQGGKGGGGGAGVGRAAGTLFAVKAGATGDVTPKAGETASDGVAWAAARAWPGAASPLVYDGRVYVLERNGGLVSCFDAKTGKAAYKSERIPGAGAFWASPWGADGQVFCLDATGATHVLKAGDEFEVVRVNRLDPDTYWATPAAADGALFVRSVESLYRIDAKK